MNRRSLFRYAVVDVNGLTMDEVMLSFHDTYEQAKWYEDTETNYSVETNILELNRDAEARIEIQLKMIEEMKETLRTGLSRKSRGV